MNNILALVPTHAMTPWLDLHPEFSDANIQFAADVWEAAAKLLEFPFDCIIVDAGLYPNGARNAEILNKVLESKNITTKIPYLCRTSSRFQEEVIPDFKDLRIETLKFGVSKLNDRARAPLRILPAKDPGQRVPRLRKDIAPGLAPNHSFVN